MLDHKGGWTRWNAVVYKGKEPNFVPDNRVFKKMLSSKRGNKLNPELKNDP